MNGDINLDAKPLSALSYKSRILLSSLLNPQKVLPSEDSDKLPRDWRGLAALVNIPSELLSDNRICQDKIAKVMEIWQQRKDGTATLGNFISYIQKLDRYDVCDDLEELYRQGQLLEETSITHLPVVQQREISVLENPRDDLITNDDAFYRTPQFYHAYVLYAKEDREFVDELLNRMRQNGLKLCTEDDLLPGFRTRYGPISRLIAERCHRIVLIYSPDFFSSPANAFLIDYGQAVGIERNRNNIIPCMYRLCELPSNHKFYHKLYYTPPGQKSAYDFWQRLSQSLAIDYTPRITFPTTSPAPIRITEMQSSLSTSCMDNIQKDLLALPPNISTTKSHSSTSLYSKELLTEDICSLSSDISEGKSVKKMSKLKRFLSKPFGGKKQKNKNAIMAEGF